MEKKIVIDLDYVKSGIGSCKFSIGNTSVICVINEIELKTSPSNVQIRIIDTDIDNNHQLNLQLTNIIDQILFMDLLPFTNVIISVQVLCNDGSLFSVCSNAIYASCVHAGIPVKNSIFLTIGFSRTANGWIYNPSARDQDEVKSICNIGKIGTRINVYDVEDGDLPQLELMDQYLTEMESKLQNSLRNLYFDH